MPARTSLATAARPATRPVSWGHQASDTEHGTRSLIVIALAPHEGHTAALYLSGAEVVGVLWYLLYLRRRIAGQSAGVLRKEVVELESSAV